MIPLAIVFSLITVETPQIAMCIDRKCEKTFFAKPPKDYALVPMRDGWELYSRKEKDDD